MMSGNRKLSYKEISRTRGGKQERKNKIAYNSRYDIFAAGELRCSRCNRLYGIPVAAGLRRARVAVVQIRGEIPVNLEEVLRAVQEEQAFAALRPHWRESLACFPAGTPDFLHPVWLREMMEYTGIDPGEFESVMRLAGRIAEDRALKLLAWHCRRLLFANPGDAGLDIKHWPKMIRALGTDANYFYFILALSSAGDVLAFHRKRGLPPDITRATCADIWRFLPRYAGQRVRLPETLTWLRHAVFGNLFKIGRHQYIRSMFRGCIQVYRHGASGNVIALAEGRLRLNSAGYFDGDAGIQDPRAWTTFLSMDERTVHGFPVVPRGYVLQNEVRLRLDEWTRLLFRDTPVLDMHIPPAEPMSLADSVHSMRKAREFFCRYFPERTFRAFACHSWLFNTQLPDILGEQSNIAAWQREQYLFPVPAPTHAGLPFIFSHAPFDLETAPRDTRLRRGVAALLEKGEPLRNGGMFALPENLPHSGSRFYRNGWERARKRLGLPPG